MESKTDASIEREALMRMAEVREGIEEVKVEGIVKAAKALRRVKKRGGTVWLMGNGGSASTCTHFANDLVKMGGIRAIALPDQTGVMSAYANDVSYGEAAAYALSVMGEGRDCAIGISCSGNSENVIKYFEEAKEKGMMRIGLSGDGGKMEWLGLEIAMAVKGHDITIQEDIHLVICHTIARMVGYGECDV